jgi:hypothetical protein
MDEYLLSVMLFENRQSLSQYVLMILIVFIAVNVLLLYFSCKTRIILPSAQYKINCQQQAEIDCITVKKTGFGLVRPEIAVKKSNSYISLDPRL